MNKLLFYTVLIFCSVDFIYGIPIQELLAVEENPQLSAAEESEIIEQVFKYILDVDQLAMEELPIHFVVMFNDLAKLNNLTIYQALLLFKFGLQPSELSTQYWQTIRSGNLTLSDNFDPEVREVCDNIPKPTTTTTIRTPTGTIPETGNDYDENSKTLAEKYLTTRRQFLEVFTVTKRLSLIAELCKLYRDMVNQSNLVTNSIM